MFILPQIEKVPIARLFTNLESRLAKNTNSFEAAYNLARLHSMAYSTNLITVDVDKKDGDPHYYYFGSDSGVPRTVQVFKTPEDKSRALKHLTNAISLYERSLALLKRSTNASTWYILPTQLGLAWCLDQSGQREKALDAYRKTLRVAWKKEVTGDFNFTEWAKGAWSEVKSGQNPIHAQRRGSIGPGVCFSDETIGYLLKLLDPVKDAKEIAQLKNDKQTLLSMGRAVTPILIPLEPKLEFDDLVDPTAGVVFDLDGSGLPRKWGWLTPKAAWLVYDSDDSGNITSALQMFGSVTFWFFWEDGYAALSSLDDNGDGALSGAELCHLALWQDSNSNGISDPGEVRSVQSFGIESISCSGTTFRAF
jgi:tetratricopeptide (TPR) repeat protein